MINIIEVKKNENDGKLIMEWRNDIETRNNFYNNNLFIWNDFRNIFYEKYFIQTVPPLFALYENKKVCFIGCRDTNIKYDIEISINLDPHYRNKNLSSIIVKKAIDYIKKKYPLINNIIAEIKVENIASNKIFIKNNFKYISTNTIKNNIMNIYNYDMNENNKNIFSINNRKIGQEYPTYIIAELSCNHNQDINLAYKLIDAAKESGANAVKLQTYTPDTMTIDCDKPIFKDCLKGTLWEGQTLYQLYSKAYTPWEWHKELKDYANSKGLDLFSSPFDSTAVDFLETLEVPAYKIASFEITDHILIKKIAKTGKPVIISSGMASLSELNDAISLLRENGTTQIAMLKCTSAYPAKPEDANLNTIKHMIETFNVVGGLSDHTLGIEVPIASVVLGGRIIEKHFKLTDDSGSEDDAFSLKPDEFKKMVDSVRIVEKTLGTIHYDGVNNESKSKKFRRSLFIVKDVKKGELLTEENIRSIRPSNGLHTRYYNEILGKTARFDLEKGTPLSWDIIK
jgi:pseudaminic acid synthase